MTDTPTISLPTPPPPGANYVSARRHGDLLFIAGQLPFVDGRLPRTGKVGDTVDVPAAAELARLAALNGLAVADASLGSLADVSVVQLTVFVASTSDFTEQHLVANGASDVLIEVLGERGRHARTAVATPVLPLDTPVEVQLVLGVGAP
ncbi:RidA family protein [Modestobacter sp. VKM Ac-2985]|uniref:RidA family protein n=1 Tax=Modestobacter sp. VKM Ac-2985 TaxID=3004139 RepID=UPI0022AB9272|nr:RidA family protein [Modestobacter sp. VKM Ac-2985]MCZ2839867.1 RidA family protein [Modestobacter sp. VKM Ac-2985]